MADGDDGALGGPPGPGQGTDVPSWRAGPDPPDGRQFPGPRPGHYPPAAEFGAPAEPRPPGRTRHAGARRRPGPAPAQQQLMARISAGRRARQRRALLMISGAMSALVLLAAGSAWAITSYVNGSLGRVNAGTAGLPSSGPLNFLVAGVDDRAGLTRQQQATLHVGPSEGESDTDTLMIVHVPAGRRSVQVVSLPRDSWVNIPGHGMNKINAALGIGGPRLMVQTVEQDTGVTINDYVSVNFLGFVKVIDALGGVNICLPYAVDDSYSGLHLSAGDAPRQRGHGPGVRPGPALVRHLRLRPDPGSAAAHLLRVHRGHQLGHRSPTRSGWRASCPRSPPRSRSTRDSTW